jgi:hypothetical protein
MLTLNIGSYITCSRKGAIVKVVEFLEIFEFEVWGWFKG